MGSVSNELLGKSRTTFLHPMSLPQNCHSVFVPLIRHLRRDLDSRVCETPAFAV